jgi:hypothetical protein
MKLTQWITDAGYGQVPELRDMAGWAEARLRDLQFKEAETFIPDDRNALHIATDRALITVDLTDDQWTAEATLWRQVDPPALTFRSISTRPANWEISVKGCGVDATEAGENRRDALLQYARACLEAISKA